VKRRWVVLATVCCCALATSPAHASFPGPNGKLIVADGSDGLWSLNPDGSGKTFLTTGDSPDWSPDGSKLAFTRGNTLYISNADGTGAAPIHSAGDYINAPAWSPDQTQLVFQLYDQCDETGCISRLYRINADGTGLLFIGQAFGGWVGWATWSPNGSRLAVHGCLTPFPGCEGSLYTMDPDGSNLTTMVEPVEQASTPEWSPDGSKILFKALDPDPNLTGFATVNHTGSGFTMLNNLNQCCTAASWAPDGSRIAFADADRANCTPICKREIFTMDADGGNVTQVTANQGLWDVDWQTAFVNTYPRPKGASPVQVSRVPAYQQCTAPNRIHGPPLAFDSCSPPARGPTHLTIGTPDANGAAAKAVSYIRVGVRVGNPATPADEADVRMRGSITDVRNLSDLADYTGDVNVRLTPRTTDRNNAGGPAGLGAATTQDFTLTHPVPCAATADTTVGSTCAFQTTVEALVPGALTEGKRAIWQLQQIEVRDGAGGLFMRQGIFVP
jgi:Tol biopolymer transport system component